MLPIFHPKASRPLRKAHSRAAVPNPELSALMALMQPEKCNVEVAFDELYPLVKASLDRRVTKKATHVALADHRELP